MTIGLVGIGLAKNVFALDGLEAASKRRPVRLAIRRDPLLE